MTKATEHEWVLKTSSGQKITKVEIIDKGHGIKYYTTLDEDDDISMQESTSEYEEMFPIVDIESVSITDSFMAYNPTTPNQTRVRRDIRTAKRKQMKNFRRAELIPSFQEDGRSICYEVDGRPAVGRTPKWWRDILEKFDSEKNSRMGNILEYDAFLGTVIKRLVEKENYSVEKAWEIVCDSRINSWNLERSKSEGKEIIGKVYDRENIRQIVHGYQGTDFLLIGSLYEKGSMVSPIATIEEVESPASYYEKATGWLVLDA